MLRTPDYVRILAWILLVSFAADPANADEAARTWTFDRDSQGQIAAGFTSDAGRWEVVPAGDGNVLAQLAKNPDKAFNITLVTDTNAKDVDLSVEMRAMAGNLDQGGGLVWRAKDARNYYLARYNPLEDNFRLYHVVDGKRTLLQDVGIPHSPGVHTLRITMVGAHIQGYYDSKRFLDHHDPTFPAAGKIGLWTKSDAQSQFDNLTLSGK